MLSESVEENKAVAVSIEIISALFPSASKGRKRAGGKVYGCANCRKYLNVGRKDHAETHLESCFERRGRRRVKSPLRLLRIIGIGPNVRSDRISVKVEDWEASLRRVEWPVLSLKIKDALQSAYVEYKDGTIRLSSHQYKVNARARGQTEKWILGHLAQEPG